MAIKSFNSIDFDSLYTAADCHSVAEKFLEEFSRNRFDCPRCQKSDSITVTEKTWSCWKSGCHDAGTGRDAVGLVAIATGLDRVEAAKLLASELGIGPIVTTDTPSRAYRPPLMRPELPQPWSMDSWAAGMVQAITEAHRRLISRSDDTSRRAWDYLTNERRLKPETIERHRLGLNLEWLESSDMLPGRKWTIPPGIVIPWLAGPLGVAGANVRQFHVQLKDKYIMATGSRRRWSYPGISGPWLNWSGPVLIVEGEFDAMIGNQELNDLIPVITAGGAQSPPSESADSLWLGRCSRLLVCTDSDDAGHECWSRWKDFSPRTRRVMPPIGKDLTESVQAGADLAVWLRSICEDHGVNLLDLPGKVWEMPLGTLRGRLFEPESGFVDSYDAEERAGIEEP